MCCFYFRQVNKICASKKLKQTKVGEGYDGSQAIKRDKTIRKGIPGFGLLTTTIMVTSDAKSMD